MTKDDQGNATRYAASLFTKYMIDLVSFAVKRHDLSIEDMTIIALVFTESTRPLREDPALALQYGFEAQGLPNKYRASMTLTQIYTTLGLSRETARRKLERLVERRFLVRLKNRYLFPQPESGRDVTRDLRFYLQEQMRAILADADRLEELVRTASCNRVDIPPV